MRIRNAMESKLQQALTPQRLEIIDNSAQHAGHAGANPEGESHFAVAIVSSAFEGLGRVARQRLIYDALAEEMNDHIHALEIKALTPAEATD